MLITLVRHGNTIANNEKWLQGHVDTLLTEQGFHQAKVVGERLACESFDKVYCSDLTRCKQTAEAIAAHHQTAPIEYRLSLRERDFGTLSRKPIKFLGKESTRLQIDVDELVRRHQGETEQMFESRITLAYEEIVSEAMEANYSHILIITHGGPLYILLLRWTNKLGYKVEDGQINMNRCGNTSVSRVRIHPPHQGTIEFYNSMAHLKVTEQSAPPAV
ncbi:hypothetical protein DFQ28_006643 [Apophysomyces sp. BC1034]|nr:hypothetical protein DFQ30_004688 [Apophysomyces sp. BC1015]KAG0182540.1 hypothetical protein DFQ29_003542 [Apophysomyces sp. BC1021]KAG0193049.1 hypothetical protein DFQ28_006643 [Apophysomyces sp. BC1034]